MPEPRLTREQELALAYEQGMRDAAAYPMASMDLLLKMAIETVAHRRRQWWNGRDGGEER